MTFLYLESPPATGKSPQSSKLSAIQRLWVRVLSVFEAKLKEDIDPIARARQNALVSVWGLAYLALAFDQDRWAVERLQVTLKAAQAYRYKPIGADECGSGRPSSRNRVHVLPEEVRSGVEEYIAAQLAGALPQLDEEQRYIRYNEFEARLLHKIFEINKKCNRFEDRLSEIHAHCETIRKKADDEIRFFLRVLQSRADTALSDIYEISSQAVMDVLENRLGDEYFRGKLSRSDITVNRFLHSVQDELGGLVLAMHPIGGIILDSGKAIKILSEHALNPESQDARDRFNSILLQATRIYRELIDDRRSDKENSESLDQNSDNPELPPLMDTIPAATKSPDVELANQEMFSRISEILKQDESIQKYRPVFEDRIFHELPVDEVANKYSISNGEVSKRTNAAKKILRARLIKDGFSHDAE